ncbi:hypothetical protein D9615_007566 [Tricholomella constricta]|uniref:Ribosomal RNA methyltransferase FtsJ domain-containing protein n=1 Tax=Tricholomella constricta TaxID=117010 RepID=A0A8H5H703_9AGAR|nr:hypothetical protein D9615_007566 [Tricholomella constricta]
MNDMRPLAARPLTATSNHNPSAVLRLLTIDGGWGPFLSKPDVSTVLILGAAPGGWSQVVAEKLGWPPPCEGNVTSVAIQSHGV